MRNLFLALLLANLSFLGWRYWIAPPEVPAAAVQPVPDAGIQLVAVPHLSRDAAVPQQGAGAPPADAAPATGCVRAGPVADGQTVDRLRADLAAHGVTAATRAEEGQVWVGHWVQLPSVPTRAEADRLAARLVAGGVPDAYVFQTTPPYSVSLGVFRDRDRADKVAAAAAALGLRAEVSDRFRAGMQYWLILRADAARDVDWTELGADAGSRLQTQPAPCPDTDVGTRAGP